MAVTPYRPVQWNEGPIELGKLQTMAQNEQWLFENTPKMLYKSNGVNRTESLKIAAGSAPYSAVARTWLSFDIYFGNYFSPGCRPIVVATVQSRGDHGWYYHNIRGIGKAETIDHRGFHCFVLVRKDMQIVAGGFVHWIAVGW